MASLYLNHVAPNPAWLSPALSVVKSAGLDQDAGTPVLDVVPSATVFQRIQAVAGNDTGSTFFNVHVQVWALAFATATASSIYLESMGGTKGRTIPPGAPPIDIGPGQQQPFPHAWDSTHKLKSDEQEIIDHFVDNEVHCCIYGNVHHPDDPTSAPIPDMPSGPGAMLDVVGNRHHAQRNMTIKMLTAGDSMDFHMYAANPVPDEDQDVFLQVAELPPRELQDWELAELDALGPWIRRSRKSPREGIPGIEIVIDGEPTPVRIAREPLKDLEMDITDAGAGRERKLALGADEARRMRLNATVPDEDFALRILDVTQTQGDRTVGGARVMVLTVPAELRKRRDY